MKRYERRIRVLSKLNKTDQLNANAAYARTGIVWDKTKWFGRCRINDFVDINIHTISQNF